MKTLLEIIDTTGEPDIISQQLKLHKPKHQSIKTQTMEPFTIEKNVPIVGAKTKGSACNSQEIGPTLNLRT